MEKKNIAVTCTRTHIIRINRPPSEPLRHEHRCKLPYITRSILKKMSDVVTLGTFCYRDQSFINRRGVDYFFTEGEVLNLSPPPLTHTHTHKASRKNSDPLRQNILESLTRPHPLLARHIYKQTT